MGVGSESLALHITINMYTKCNTKMKQLTENYSIMLNKKQHENITKINSNFKNEKEKVHIYRGL